MRDGAEGAVRNSPMVCPAKHQHVHHAQQLACEGPVVQWVQIYATRTHTHSSHKLCEDVGLGVPVRVIMAMCGEAQCGVVRCRSAVVRACGALSATPA